MRSFRDLLPNLLTCLRILLTPVIVAAILQRNCDLALPITMIAGFTDTADGYLARRMGTTSRVGAWLDPIADKLLLTSLYISFGVADLVPAWLVWLVVGRDGLIVGMAAAGLVVTTIRDFPPSIWGKLSTVVQIAASVVLLASCAEISRFAALIPLTTIAVATVTAWSGAHYVWHALVLLRGARQKV